jgi:hypothetical protein
MAVKEAVRREDRNFLLNVIESEYIDYMIDRHQIQPLALLWDSMQVSDSERMIATTGRGYFMEEGDQVACPVFAFQLPFEGDGSLFNYAPTTHLLWSIEASVHASNRLVSFEIVNWSSNDVSRELKHTKQNLNMQVGHVNNDVRGFNNALPKYCRKVFDARKQEHLKAANLLASLGVPIASAKAVPSTFTVPISKIKPIVKPAVADKPFAPEPVLSLEVFHHILTVCRDAGREFERHPSIYANKDEETLRDHFLMVLAPHFESAAGETFNKAGKTDILIRHEKANLFVAECKFWTGAKAVLAAVSQLLGYLTWRDSKVALILFIRNKDVDSVIKQIKPALSDHDCYIRTIEQKDEGWIEFEFRLAPDNSRSVTLAVLAFHFP